MSETTSGEPMIADSVETPADGVAFDPLALAAAERERRLRRFNWLAVYLPLIVVVLLALAAWLLLGWVTLFAAAAGPTGQASGLADSFLVLTCLLPYSLVCAALPAGGIYLLYRRRQSGSWLRGRVTHGLRTVDGYLARGDTLANSGEAQVRSYVGSARSRINQILDSIDRLVARVRDFVEQRLRG